MPTSSVMRREPGAAGLYDVLDLILDKGLVIDAYVRVSIIGIEILTIDLRIVIASVDTYLRFAEATDRLRLEEKSRDLPEFIEGMTTGVASGKTKGVIGGAKEEAGDALHRTGERVKQLVTRDGGDDDDEK